MKNILKIKLCSLLCLILLTSLVYAQPNVSSPEDESGVVPTPTPTPTPSNCNFKDCKGADVTAPCSYDINRDGIIDDSDIDLLTQYISQNGENQPLNSSNQMYDLNGDGRINRIDLAAYVSYANNLPTCEPGTGPCVWVLGVSVEGDNQDHYTLDRLFSGSNNVNASPCLTNMMNNVANVFNSDPRRAYKDDCAALYALNTYIRPNTGSGAHCFSGQQNHAINCNRSGGGGGAAYNNCFAGYAFFDDNCNPVNTSFGANPNICGNLRVNYSLSSPISLLWNGSDLPDPVAVNFSLTLGEKNQGWTLWKGSETSPLVVYDPEHKGQITSATQLFGNWTFGGKNKLSSLKDVSYDAKPWANGYEALATLDLDNNGKVSGEELTDLGLWFDKNRNGISEEGEVVDIRKSGVVSLLYGKNAELKVEANKDIRLDFGYEVEDAKGIKEYASVDWYSYEVGHPSQAALFSIFELNDAENNKKANTEVLKNSNIDQVKNDTKDSSIAKKDPAVANISGVWEWKTEGKYVNNGFFILHQNENQEIVGYTLSETSLKSDNKTPANEPRKMITNLAVLGRVDGSKVYLNTMRTLKINLESSASLEGNGETMSGKTSVSTGGDMFNEAMSYTWKAKKVN